MNDHQVIETMQQIGSMLLRKLQGNLNEEELSRLNTWLDERDEADRKFFEEMLNWDNVDAALQQLYHIDEEAALTDVVNTIQTHPLQVIPVVPVRKISNRSRYYRYVTAAVTTGVVITATVWFFARNNKKPEVATVPVKHHYQQDVQPGGDKAVLTLADGRTITLDDAQNGVLTKEGNTAVNKKDGVVVYQSPAGTAQPTTVVSYNTLTTPRGGQYQVILPDGSKVWLNAASSIKYPTVFTGNERKVELTGEGYFEVAKNASMPFHVKVNKMDVEVLGTHFNVNTYDDEEAIKTTLLEGKVRVVNNNNQNSEVTLNPGEQAISLCRLPIADCRLTIDHSPNIEEVMAWKNGLFQFQDASIESIMRQVARWYDVEVEYQGNIKKQFVGKIPRRVPVSTLLNILESTGWVHFAINGKKIMVTP